MCVCRVRFCRLFLKSIKWRPCRPLSSSRKARWWTRLWVPRRTNCWRPLISMPPRLLQLEQLAVENGMEALSSYLLVSISGCLCFVTDYDNDNLWIVHGVL
ncbi:unnamed protein product [Linum tenue]|uniref:Uncharacterized protein n=1 Tax=Linum tenue TaxID=586396 RepID=A0AAV0HCK0_9ROSI|nr:unnamed protein product [Linum tenue]